jgi:hypothetical protein
MTIIGHRRLIQNSCFLHESERAFTIRNGITRKGLAPVGQGGIRQVSCEKG